MSVKRKTAVKAFMPSAHVKLELRVPEPLRRVEADAVERALSELREVDKAHCTTDGAIEVLLRAGMVTEREARAAIKKILGKLGLNLDGKIEFEDQD